MSTDTETPKLDKLERYGKAMMTAMVPVPIFLYSAFSISSIFMTDPTQVLGLVGPESEVMTSSIAGFYEFLNPGWVEHTLFWFGHVALIYGAALLGVYAIAFQWKNPTKDPMAENIRAAQKVVTALGWIIAGLFAHTFVSYRLHDGLDLNVFHFYAAFFALAILATAERLLSTFGQLQQRLATIERGDFISPESDSQ